MYGSRSVLCKDDELIPTEKQGYQPSSTESFASSLIWMTINTLATIGIVFTNKAIFSDPSLKLAQLTFAAFHFLITYLTLFVLSRPSISLFTPRRIPLLDILPLSLTMSLNVILPNLSLAFSTVTFYQIARILLNPTVAALNYLLYRATLPPRAILALIPACIGVGMVSYYDSLPPPTPAPETDPHKIKTTSPLGILFALLGTLASSLYTVWIGAFHRRLRASSMQLLFSQAPLSAAVLLYVIPFVDTWPASWAGLPSSRWGLVLLSGGLAAGINISQFFIVAQTGPVSSTVVGHVKTCAIVALGWLTSGRRVGDGSLVGVSVAVGGIIAYSVIMLQEKGKQAPRLGGR
ncbi:triose-phosphate transporter family-domain-containing protein [Achaetomium macrosporum]|uniref:GDP-mannose transporter n=1 Tax=Achaetomium macrosporum TaxID=79813 RepID=A0AAN7CCD7_9PEZI|nr:triose-phosphate transporter family-domain-containing protein [Achaetomium macrosporum]